VFLLDEPLSNLDALLRIQMRDELIKLHRRVGATMIHVTHDQVEAMTMGSRIAVMQDGMVQQVGAPQEVYDYPQNRFVATFIGTPQMNLFEGDLERQNGELVFRNQSMRVCLGPPLSQALERAPMQSGLVTLGVRSEDVDVFAEPRSGLLEGRIALAESVGSDVYLRVNVGEDECVARSSPRANFHEGQTVWICFGHDRLHLFADNELSIRSAK
jgi:multiple sugar transport system ATP-binding protein